MFSNPLSTPLKKENYTSLYQPLYHIFITNKIEHINEKISENAIEHKVTIDLVEPLGMETMVYFTVNGVQLCGRVSPENNLTSDNTISLNFNKKKFHIIDPETDKVL